MTMTHDWTTTDFGSVVSSNKGQKTFDTDLYLDKENDEYVEAIIDTNVRSYDVIHDGDCHWVITYDVKDDGVVTVATWSDLLTLDQLIESMIALVANLHREPPEENEETVTVDGQEITLTTYYKLQIARMIAGDHFELYYAARSFDTLGRHDLADICRGITGMSQDIAWSIALA